MDDVELATTEGKSRSPSSLLASHLRKIKPRGDFLFAKP